MWQGEGDDDPCSIYGSAIIYCLKQRKALFDVFLKKAFCLRKNKLSLYINLDKF